MKKGKTPVALFQALIAVSVILIASFFSIGCNKGDEPSFTAINLPIGFKIEKVAEGLSFPTSVTWDNDGKMYVLEAGGGFLSEPPPARILQINNGQTTEIIKFKAQASGTGIQAPFVGLTFYNNSFYITHRRSPHILIYLLYLCCL